MKLVISSCDYCNSQHPLWMKNISWYTNFGTIWNIPHVESIRVLFHTWVISRQLIQQISKMQPTLSDFYEIRYTRTSFPDSKYTFFFKIGQVELKL